jgi:hypothetical protein
VTRVGHGVDLRVDLAAVEEPLEIRIDGERFVTTMRTPGADKDLAAGLLLAERIVHAATDIRSIDQVDQATVDVRLNAEAAARARTALASRRLTTTTSACGVCGRQAIDDVLVLPAATRYESPGGGTETSTERRIIFSPEIPGRRCGSAHPEWWALTEAAARAHPGRAADIRFESAAAIRDEIGRCVPLYRGIERLNAKGDQIQWGGRRLYEDGRYATPDGKAHFVAVTPAGRTREPGTFYLSTRRGKQFNSMVQRGRDPLTGADRDAVLICRADAESLGRHDGDRVRLTSASGSYDGRLLFAPMRPGNLEVHWPEGNVLLGSQVDPESMEPDYNAVVRVVPRTRSDTLQGD